MTITKPTIELTSDTMNRGFMLTFENGVTVSVRFGAMNHSDGFTTAECAAMFNKEFIQIPGFKYRGDDVLANQSPDELAKFMDTAALLDTPEEYYTKN